MPILADIIIVCNNVKRKVGGEFYAKNAYYL